MNTDLLRAITPDDGFVPTSMDTGKAIAHKLKLNTF